MPHTDRTFYPIPGCLNGRPVRVMVFNGEPIWPQIADHIAYAFGADPDSIHSHDCYWGEDESVDVVTINGEIVGSFDRALSADEWAALLSVSDNTARARAA